MTLSEKRLHNQSVIALICSQGKCGYRVPSYQAMIQMLNNRELKTSTGNLWTRKALFRMLQRQGFSGLHGLLR